MFNVTDAFRSFINFIYYFFSFNFNKKVAINFVCFKEIILKFYRPLQQWEIPQLTCLFREFLATNFVTETSQRNINISKKSYEFY